RVVEIPTDLAIKAPKQIINKIDKEINN
ncbi:TPA_asm: PTS fructose transporter subunit IIB, partial [Listeria monocytogenes]|nr:PTS fructose transporter subunit IIB [Listeria monocytogenes]